MSSSSNRPGFTFLEYLMYSAILAVLLLVAMNVLLTLLDGRAKLGAAEEVAYNGRAVMQRMMFAARNARAVLEPTPGATGTRLRLQMNEPTIDPTIFSLADGVISVKEGTQATTSLMADEVTVRQLVIRNLTVTSSQDIVRVELAVSSTNPTNDPDLSFGEAFYGTAVTRQRL
jgi:type II secretory pathway pseudopilin PulG